MSRLHPNIILFVCFIVSFAIALAILLSSCSHSASPPSDPRIPANFAMVRLGLYRGGRPNALQLDYLRTLGVHTILDLEINDGIEATGAQIEQELTLAGQRGFLVVRFPISAFEPALSHRFDMLIDGALSLMVNQSAGTIYVHCLHGQDRTGMVVGLERVLQEHWAPESAYQEMIRMGFHPGFLGLKEYFERRVGREVE